MCCFICDIVVGVIGCLWDKGMLEIGKGKGYCGGIRYCCFVDMVEVFNGLFKIFYGYIFFF